MGKTKLLAIFLYLFFHNLSAQEQIVVGQIHKIHSEKLNQELELQIYLPDDYSSSGKDYPTLYILDGQWYFLNGVAVQESLRGNSFMSAMIVVGVNMVDRPYRSKLFNQWDSFIDFLESEMVSYVDNRFRTSDHQLIFGWENSGYLSTELILRENSPFECAIVSNGAYIDKEELESLTIDKEKYLFIAGSKKDIYSIDGINQANEVLTSVDPENLVWKHRLFDEEIHESLTNISLYKGIKFYFHNYGSLVFGSIDEFYDKGGIPFLTQYFKERAERFGFAPEIDASTKNSLIWLSWKRDNFEAFDRFMNAFQDVLSTPRYASAYWQNRLAQFYLKYDSYDKAIEFFNRGITEYPDERYLAQMHHGLGNAYLGKGESKNAKKNLKKAVEIAKDSSDDKLEYYEEELRKVN